MRIAFFALAVACLAGCAEEEPGPCEHRVCSIDSDACVQRVAEVVACERGVEPLTPEVRYMTQAEVIAEWNADMPTPEEEQANLRWIDAEGLVGLMPAGYTTAQADADRADGIAAYYSSDTKEVTIIVDSGVDDDAFAYEILAHEMVHVYQDVEWDLTDLLDAYATTFDRFLGLRAVVEGDASLFQSIASAALLDFTPSGTEWRDFIATFQAEMLARSQESTTPSLDTLVYFPYAFGLGYVYPAWDEDGMEGMARAVNDPPDSVRQVMRGYPGEHREPINDDEAFDAAAVPVLPGFTFVDGAHKGTWQVNAMLQQTGASEHPFHTTALDPVGADYFSVFVHDETGALAVVWRIQNGGAFADSLELPSSAWSSDEELASRTWRFVDSDVVLVAGTTGLVASELFDTIEGWQTPQAALEAAGTLEGRHRSCAHRFGAMLHAPCG